MSSPTDHSRLGVQLENMSGSIESLHTELFEMREIILPRFRHESAALSAKIGQTLARIQLAEKVSVQMRYKHLECLARQQGVESMILSVQRRIVYLEGHLQRTLELAVEYGSNPDFPEGQHLRYCQGVDRPRRIELVDAETDVAVEDEMF